VCCHVKGLIVDQTIEKVSFCAPDRNSERGFAYICRDGTSRRWMCHGFFALKETVMSCYCLTTFVDESRCLYVSLHVCLSVCLSVETSRPIGGCVTDSLLSWKR